MADIHRASFALLQATCMWFDGDAGRFQKFFFSHLLEVCHINQVLNKFNEYFALWRRILMICENSKINGPLFYESWILNIECSYNVIHLCGNRIRFYRSWWARVYFKKTRFLAITCVKILNRFCNIYLLRFKYSLKNFANCSHNCKNMRSMLALDW